MSDFDTTQGTINIGEGHLESLYHLVGSAEATADILVLETAAGEISISADSDRIVVERADTDA